MGIMSSIVTWFIKAGVKLITGIIRFAVKLSSTPGARMPTEDDVLCELGGSLIRKVATVKLKNRCGTLLSPFRKLLAVINKRKKVPSISCDTDGLIIDI